MENDDSISVEWTDDDESNGKVASDLEFNWTTDDDDDDVSNGKVVADIEFDWTTDDDDDEYNEGRNVVPNKEDSNLFLLIEMGFGVDEALAAIDKSGKEAPVEQLIEYIQASQYCCDAQGNPPESSSSSNHSTTEIAGPTSRNDSVIAEILEMGYKHDEASAAVDTFGSHTPIAELVDFIEAARFCDDGDTFEEQSTYLIDHALKRKKVCSIPSNKKMKQRISDETTRMVGFGIPNMPGCRRPSLPDIALGPPYFYFENVACAPVGSWPTIQRALYNIEAEFVDSRHFCAANRKRGYVHNLPVEKRFPLTPIPPATIHEAFPETKEWWPSWDTRQKFNCLLTCIGSAPLTHRIKKVLKEHSKGNRELPEWVKKYVMRECRKWNLVWVREHTVAPLEPRQMEELMGFPIDHTRGVCNPSERHTFLGNTFQIHTVAFHLSPLKQIYPGGINVLSLFSGIGGAEVALHRLGIPLKTVVSVEISERCREILQSWWEQTGQTGKLIHEVHDVTEVRKEVLEKWISRTGYFDLVIGGSPCNNLAGGNRHSRVGLEGKHSSLFFHYVRILKEVRALQNGT